MLPVETILALFPSGTEVCRVGWLRALRLLPVTLAHAAAMEAMGCGLGRELDDAHALIAAWLLSQPPERMRRIVADRTLRAREATAWMRRRRRCVARIARAVNGALAAAFRPFVPPKQDEGRVYTDGEPSGFGWPLEIAESLCGEYGWDFDAALATPLPRALALVSVARTRNGGENGGPDYYERIKAKAINELHGGANGGGRG